MEDELPPDTYEKKVRIGCGVVTGIVVGLFFGIGELGLTAGWLWAFAGFVAVVFALLALRYGDRFWLGLLEFFHG